MKRYIWIFLAVFTFSVLAGCGKSAENFKEPTNFYYITTDVSFFEEDSVISPEIPESAQSSCLKALLRYKYVRAAVLHPCNHFPGR